MSEAAATASPTIRAIDSAFLLKVFYVFAALAVLSFGISVGGKWLGRSIALAGHTDDPTLREVVIGNNVIAAPANAIRFERQRRDGVATRLDLYLRWPQLDGYTDAARDDFNNTNGARNILFLSFEERMMSRDMSGRLEPDLRADAGASGTARSRRRHALRLHRKVGLSQRGAGRRGGQHRQSRSSRAAWPAKVPPNRSRHASATSISATISA